VKKIIFIDMDDTLFDYKGAYLQAKNNYPQIEFPQSQPGFFVGLRLLPGAKEAMNFFLLSNEYDPYILTAPSVMNPHCYTEKRLSVERELGYIFAERLFICPDKSLARGDILIDDMISGRGQESFNGQLIQFGSESYPNWKVIISELKNIFI